VLLAYPGCEHQPGADLPQHLGLPVDDGRQTGTPQEGGRGDSADAAADDGDAEHAGG
jgi:hypothetical protein